jgi:hypothetical protein
LEEDTSATATPSFRLQDGRMIENLAPEPQPVGDRWYCYINEKYRLTMLLILEELSRLRRIQKSFMLVGGLSLLLWGRLKHQVLWDIDLLFRDKFAILKFLALPKGPEFDVVSMEDGFADSETIISFHTAWTLGSQWINLDYLSRGNWYYFHKTTIDRQGDFEETVKIEGREIHIKLPTAYPWDMFIEKALSPRLENDLSSANDLSYDLRHVFILYEQEKENPQFWSYIRGKAKEFSRLPDLKQRLLWIFGQRESLGYGHIVVTDWILNEIKGWDR